MKRRNADIGKMRRPIKRIKIIDGMYANPMLFVKFILLWSSIGLADYMLEFRFEFLWPLWLMIKAIYQCYQCKGLTYSVFFTCVAVSTDMVCYFFIPMQMLSYLAGVYVWVNSIWSTFESKGVCAQTVLMWVVMVYVEALRTGVAGALHEHAAPAHWDPKPWAAGALGFPLVSLGVGVKQLVDDKLRLRTQRLVREQNEFYFRLMREAIPEGGLTNSTYSSDLIGEPEGGGEVKVNGSAGKRRWKPHANGHCVRDTEHVSLQAKLEHLERYVERKNRARDSSSQSTVSQKSSNSAHSLHTSVQSSTQPSPHARHANGAAKGPGCLIEDANHCKGVTKSTKYDKKEANLLKDERRRKKNRDVDKDIFDSHKSKEHAKEQIDKDLESTKANGKIKECNNIHKEEEKRRDEERKREKEEERKRDEERKREREEEKKREREEEKKREREEEKKREKEREKELKEREKEREREEERERELLSARECLEEVSRLRSALLLSQKSEAESARQLAACVAADKQRRAAHADLKQQLHHKMSTWRCGERAALERKLGEERRLRLAAEQQLAKVRRTPHGECESEWCKSRLSAADSEAHALRADLQRAHERLAHAHRDLTLTNEQMAALEAEKSASSAAAAGAVGAGVVGGGGACAWVALRARAAHLEHVLSAETRLKLELLAALGDANRKVHIHQSVINRQEKELEELKAQMLAVMPADFPSSPSAVSKMRLSGGSPLDPNATVYTPKQLCSDA